jgi:hypothetical protein
LRTSSCTWIETWNWIETPIFGFEELGLRHGLGTSSSNHGSGLQTPNLGFEEEEEEEKGWDLVREPEVLSRDLDFKP